MHSSTSSGTRDAQMVLGVSPAEDNRRWESLPVFDKTATFDDMFAYLPQFDRAPFQAKGGSAANPFYHVVSRRAKGGRPAVPVGLVSTTYQLIQHREVFTAIRKAIGARDLDVGKMKCDATFTVHHERMELRVHFPRAYDADVGDGHPIGLQLCCFNSVDGRSSFGLYLGWLRFVCSNGLIVGTTTAKWKRPHRESLQLDAIGAVLADGMARTDRERKRFKRAIEEKIPDDALENWIDGPVVKTWGPKAATRIFQILSTGRDCELANPFEKALPSQRAVTLTNEVPGSIPAPATKFSVMQALSWIASHRNALQERSVMTRQIPLLLVQLRN